MRRGGVGVFRECEQSVLNLVRLLPISLSHDKEIGEMKTEFGCAKFISLLCLLNASITQSVNSKLSGGEN